MLGHDCEVAPRFETKAARATKFQHLVSGVLGAQKVIKDYVRKGKRKKLVRRTAQLDPSSSGGSSRAHGKAPQPRRSARAEVADNALWSYAEEARAQARSARANSGCSCSLSLTAVAWGDHNCPPQPDSVAATLADQASATGVRARLAQLRARVSALKDQTQALDDKCRGTIEKKGAAVGNRPAGAGAASDAAAAGDIVHVGDESDTGTGTALPTAPSSAAGALSHHSSSTSCTPTSRRGSTLSTLSAADCSAWDEDEACVSGDGYVSDLEPISKQNTLMPSAARSLIAAGGEGGEDEGSRKHTLRAQTWLTFNSFDVAGSKMLAAGARGRSRRSNRRSSNSDSLLGDGDDATLSMFDLKQQRSMRSSVVRRSVRKTSLRGSARLPHPDACPPAGTTTSRGEDDIDILG